MIDRLPWLQWVADREINNRHTDVGQAIVDYRNRNGAFKSIGDLMQVDELACMLGFTGQEPNGPDLTPDGELSDFEARDLLFARISNLVTVRRDVFSAYILVRIGEERAAASGLGHPGSKPGGDARRPGPGDRPADRA